MTQQITGSVENGDRAVADFPFYRGTVGVRVRDGSEIMEVAYRADAVRVGLLSRGRRAVWAANYTITGLVDLPARGRLDGKTVDILTHEISQIDRKMILVTIRLASEPEAVKSLVI